VKIVNRFGQFARKINFFIAEKSAKIYAAFVGRICVKIA
jgi:hypothetical protein